MVDIRIKAFSIPAELEPWARESGAPFRSG